MMKRFSVRLLIAVFTFFLGTAAVILLATSRHAPIKEYDEVAHLYTTRLQTDTAPRPKAAIKIRQSDYLEAIEITNHNEEYPVSERKLEDMSIDPIKVDLDLGENIEAQIITLRTYPGESWEFRIEQQFETSLTLMDEGPHLDLVDWKHYTSPWKDIKMIGWNKFLTSTISGSESSKFPKVTRKEIYAAVREAERKLYADYEEAAGVDPVGEKWLKVARKQCKSTQDDGCTVSISKIRFRIKVKEGDRWKIIKRMEFNVPMGC